MINERLRGCFLFNILEEQEHSRENLWLQEIQEKKQYKENKKQIENKIKLLKTQKFSIKKYFDSKKPVIFILNSLIMKEKEKKRKNQQNYVTKGFMLENCIHECNCKIQKILLTLDFYLRSSF